jgi:hypothetical protein
MDFIEALPWVSGKLVILTIVDHFSKYYHFIPLAHPSSVEISGAGVRHRHCAPT